MGLSIAQQIMQQHGGFGGPAQLLSPADVAAALGVPESDVIAIIESGELPARKIGASYRVTRSAVDAYLAS